MGIPERRKREKRLRRELVMDAAMAIFNEDGYHATTMEKIAERSELSRAALYLYFKSKDEILIHAIVSQTDYFTRLLYEVYDHRHKFRDRLLDKLWECFIKFYEKEPITFNATLYFHQSEMIRNLPKELSDSILRSGSQVVRLQHQIVEYGVQEGIFIQVDPRTLSEVIWTSFLGIVQLERSKQVLSRKIHLNVTRDLAIRVLVRGILKNKITEESFT
ncbi:MAG: helix-turn-helix transcriptional regulator [Deltaproteobacteria bacterium]|nr:helix-turn-helix transcriptional regulator [Deltaproteobacteria bacterium]